MGNALRDECGAERECKFSCDGCGDGRRKRLRVSERAVTLATHQTTRGGFDHACTNEDSPGGGAVVAAVLALVMSSAVATAGITDPPPAGYKSLWVIPGVTNSIQAGTQVVCTAHASTTFAIEIFNAAGGAAVGSASGVALAAGQSATFTTQGYADLTAYTNLSVAGAFQGSARIMVLGGGKVSCSARVVSQTGSNAGYALPVVKASGQKGE